MILAEAGNTYNYALAAIVAKGYKIFMVPDSREEFYGDIWAIGEERRFVGSTPLVVLGLIGIWEKFGDDWWTNPEKSPKQNYLNLIEDRALPDELADFDRYTEEEFALFVKDYQLLFEVLGRKKYPIADDITRAELFEIINKYWMEDE